MSVLQKNRIFFRKLKKEHSVIPIIIEVKFIFFFVVKAKDDGLRAQLIAFR